MSTRPSQNNRLVARKTAIAQWVVQLLARRRKARVAA